MYAVSNTAVFHDNIEACATMYVRVFVYVRVWCGVHGSTTLLAYGVRRVMNVVYTQLSYNCVNAATLVLLH